MAQNSNIEWTDHTVNLFWGCSKVHTGCKNCYAEKLSHRYGNSIWGENTGRKMILSAFKDLDKYQRAAHKNNELVKIFCGSMMDIFEDTKFLNNKTDEFQTTGSLRNELFKRIDEGKYNNLIFLFLSKRPLNIYNVTPEEWVLDAPKNVWFGTSVSDQETADKYIPQLQCFGLNNLFLSIEPQIGPIDNMYLYGINWVIQGGESGPKKRPFNLDWAVKMRDICKDQNVPYFFKQIDKIQPIPEHLKIREFPDFNTANLITE